MDVTWGRLACCGAGVTWVVWMTLLPIHSVGPSPAAPQVAVATAPPPLLLRGTISVPPRDDNSASTRDGGHAVNQKISSNHPPLLRAPSRLPEVGALTGAGARSSGLTGPATRGVDWRHIEPVVTREGGWLPPLRREDQWACGRRCFAHPRHCGNMAP